jgi:hypothetical protein
MTGAFSMSLSLLKVGMLGCMMMDTVPLFGQLVVGGIDLGFLSSVLKQLLLLPKLFSLHIYI